MADIFNEIDEELRQEKLGKLWDRWGVVVLAAAVAVVLAVAGWRFWEHRRMLEARAEGDAFVAAARLAADGDDKGAETALLALAKTSSGGYPVLSALRAAAARAAAGETAAAVAAFDAVAAAKTTPPRLAEVARLRAAYLAVDIEDRSAVEARATPLAVAGSPWRGQAREVLALAAWKAGDRTAIETRLAEIEGDPETTRDLADRSAVLRALLVGEGSSGKAK